MHYIYVYIWNTWENVKNMQMKMLKDYKSDHVGSF